MGMFPNKAVTLGNHLLDKLMAQYLQVVIERDPPDVIHAWDTYVLPATLRVARRLHIPIVASMLNEVNTPSAELPSFLASIVSMLMRRRDKTYMACFREADHSIAVSDYVREALLSRGIPEERCTTVYFVSVPTIKQSISRVDESRKTVFALGRLCKQKGFHVLAEAIPLVLGMENETSIDFVILGDGPYRKSFEKFVKKNDLASCVHIYGRVPRNVVQHFFERSTLVVLPTVTMEPFSRVAIEAMSYGKAVVATGVGGTPEAVIDGLNGCLVKPGNPRELAESIHFLLDNRSIRERMGQNGTLILREKFNLDKGVEGLIGVYRQTLKTKANRQVSVPFESALRSEAQGK